MCLPRWAWEPKPSRASPCLDHAVSRYAEKFKRSRAVAEATLRETGLEQWQLLEWLSDRIADEVLQVGQNCGPLVCLSRQVLGLRQSLMIPYPLLHIPAHNFGCHPNAAAARKDECRSRDG